MSLYNNILQSLSQEGLLGANLPNTNRITGIGEHAANNLGGGELARAASRIVTSTASNAARNQINKHIPLSAHRALSLGGRVAGDLSRGDISSAGLRVLDSGLLNDFLPGLSSIASQVAYWGRPTPLFGGITPTEAREIYRTMQQVEFSKKNLFLIEVSSNLEGDLISQWFNMFATELDYSPLTISGEKRKVGGTVLDSIAGNEHVELRITTLDDKFGIIKKWYEAHHNATVAQDGTVGVPASYAIKIKIVHSYVTSASALPGAYESIGWFRPSNLEINLSRHEDALQEVQMTFSQIDSFITL